jgi:AcrR family transcriptional regulator
VDEAYGRRQGRQWGVGSSKQQSSGRVRMSALQRRDQLIDVSRAIFAERGFDATSIEEIASAANISKPVVYEHFGDKESLYAMVVDREMTLLMSSMSQALTSERPRVLLEQAATALFDYIDEHTDGFRVLLRPHPRSDQRGGTFGTVMREVAEHLTDQLVGVCRRYGYPTRLAPMYAHMLVGMVALTGEWWAEVRKPSKEQVITQVVNMAWNGVSGLEKDPVLVTRGRT